MNRIILYVFQTIYCIVLFILIGISIKVGQSENYEGGLSSYSRWTSESFYYNALIAFIVSAAMYKVNKVNRYYYVICFGFSICFTSVFYFQLLGSALVILGLILNFIVTARK